jgi:RNA recognition motif-containing protein
VRSQDLQELCEQQDPPLAVTRADVLLTPHGRSKGCAIVEFATVEDAKLACVTLNDVEFHGRPIFVREDREESSSTATAPTRSAAASGATSAPAPPAPPGTQSKRVYVGNLSWTVTWQALKDHMRQAGEVVHSQIISEHNTGRSKGCGIVEYATEDEARTAITTLTDSELEGRTIFVREDREKVPATGGAAVTTTAAGGGGGRGGGRGGGGRGGGRGSSPAMTPSGRGGGRGAAAAAGGRGGGRGRGGGGRGGYGSGETGESSGLQLFVANLSYDTSWQDLKDHFKQYGDVERADARRGVGTVRFTKNEDAQAAIDALNGVELHGRVLEVRMDQRG